MNPLTLIDLQISELRWAAAYYWSKGQRDEARKCFHEVRGLRTARGIVERCASHGERVAA